MKPDEFKIVLWRLMHGIKIPFEVVKKIRDVSSENSFRKFFEIYYDPDQSFLLAIDAQTAEDAAVVAGKSVPGTKASPAFLAFVVSPEYREIKRCWEREMLEEVWDYARGRDIGYLEDFVRCISDENEYAAAKAFVTLAQGLKQETESEVVYIAFEVLFLYSGYIPREDFSTVLILYGIHQERLRKMAAVLDEMNARLSRQAQDEQRWEDIEDDNFPDV